jgi:hypothetical protein
MCCKICKITLSLSQNATTRHDTTHHLSLTCNQLLSLAQHIIFQRPEEKYFKKKCCGKLFWMLFIQNKNNLLQSIGGPFSELLTLNVLRKNLLLHSFYSEETYFILFLKEIYNYNFLLKIAILVTSK